MSSHDRFYFPISEMGRVRLGKAKKFGPSHTASKPDQSGQTFNHSVMLPATMMGGSLEKFFHFYLLCDLG